MRKLMVIPSRHNLLRDAKPLEEIRRQQVYTLVVPRAVKGLFEQAIRSHQVGSVPELEFTNHCVAVLIGLNRAGEFIGSYSDPSWPAAELSLQTR